MARHHGRHQQQADGRGNHHGKQRDRKIRTGTGHQPAQHISANTISTQHVSAGRRSPRVESVSIKQRIWRPHQRNSRHNQPYRKHDQRILATSGTPYGGNHGFHSVFRSSFLSRLFHHAIRHLSDADQAHDAPHQPLIQARGRT